jgi:hypothetical protein
MVVIGKDAEHHSMDVMDDETVELLEKFIKRMERRLYIHKIDYQLGVIVLGYIYNIGTDDEWKQDEFMEVNVAAESVPCLMWEVVNKVFHKCV